MPSTSASEAHGLTYRQNWRISSFVAKRVREWESQTLLDIGAGYPATALPIAAAVQKYRAVEMNSEAAEKLRAAGLDVVEAFFPCQLDERYDVVLASHSLPPDEDGIRSFIAAAHRLRAPGGRLLVLTFQGGVESIESLRLKLGLNASDRRAAAALGGALAAQGPYAETRISSYVRARSAAAMTDFLAPWLCGRALTPEQRVAVAREIEYRYALGPGDYAFPTEHRVSISPEG